MKSFLKVASGFVVLMIVLTAVFISMPFADVTTGPHFENGFPNDPEFTGVASGKSPENYSPTDFQYEFFSSFDELAKLFEGHPISFPLAKDPENAPGMSLTRTWNESRFNYGIGRPDVVIAYVEGGINWFDTTTVPDIADKIYLNKGELIDHAPEYNGNGQPVWDTNHDGRFSVSDYEPKDTHIVVVTSSDPKEPPYMRMECKYTENGYNGHPAFFRVVNNQIEFYNDPNGNGILDAEDLIVEFSDGIDNNGNGYVDDISGWDFYNNKNVPDNKNKPAYQNDPATYDTTYGHANGQMARASAITNNNFGGASLCPDCMLLPVKAGCEALDRTDDLAQAWLFAADSGASVIVSTTADLGYSTFMEEAVDYITRKGVVIVESSNDFNSTDHQGGMFHANVLPGNGLVPNTAGKLGTLGTQTTTFRERSSVTSWGTHSMFSVSTQGGTTSESTPTLGGLVAMVKSDADDAYENKVIDAPITGFELVQLLISTSSRVEDTNLPWPGKPGDFNLAYGYGRPNVYKAVNAVYSNKIPPVAVIDSPRWYTLVDPTVTTMIPVSGRVSANRSKGYSWELQLAFGPEPTESDFRRISNGTGTAPFEGLLGVIDLNKYKDEVNKLISKQYSLSTDKQLSTTEQYAVTVQLVVTDKEKNVGENRRSINIYHDSTWKKSFPKYIGPGGDSQACLADIQGQGWLAIVFGDSDGYVHAIDSKTGDELQGWPVHTNPTEVVKQHEGVDPRFEPVVTNISVGDLDADGKQWIVVTTTTGRTYVFDAYGGLRTGWPQTLNKGVEPLPRPRPKLSFSRLPTCGAFASPVLFDIDGNKKLEIIQAGADGYLHVWNADGSDLKGWPVEVKLPSGYNKPDNLVMINDHKITNTPCIADLDGDRKYEIVVRTNYNYTKAADLQLMYKMHMIAYHSDGTIVKGWPVELDGMACYYGSAQEFVTEGSGAPVACDVDGDGADEIAVSPMFSHPWLIKGDGKIITQYSSGFDPLPRSADVIEILTALATDMPMSFTTSGAFGKFGGDLSFAQTGSGIQGILFSVLAPGRGTWLKNYERVVDAQTGKARNGFPAFFQGLNFLSAPIIADVTGDGKAEIVDAGDSSALHAYTEGGTQAEGFPKFTTGWAIWSPSAGDLDGDGLTELVMLTREGYLTVWSTNGKASANTEWWHNQHDEWNTGRYGTDTRPPGIIRDVKYDAKAGEITFKAPGDDWYAGKAAKYIVEFIPGEIIEFPVKAPAGSYESITVPADTQEIILAAVDKSGNRGVSITTSITKAVPEETVGDDGGSSSSGWCFIGTAL